MSALSRVHRCFGRSAVYLVAAALLATWVAGRSGVSRGEEKASAKDREAAKAGLAEFNSLIGGWRGVGQPQRNSSKDAWSETAEWNWHFEKDAASLRYTVKNGKQLASAELTYDPAKKLYRMTAALPGAAGSGAAGSGAAGGAGGAAERRYEGKLTGDKLVLDAPEDKDGFAHRVTITKLNEKRTLVLFERRRASQNFHTRVAEVGYTREGTTLAVEGAGEPECVVSGGKGTIKVTYKGETWYVCCTGCKQAFDDDPEGILAEYKMKLAERKKKLSSGK